MREEASPAAGRPLGETTSASAQQNRLAVAAVVLAILCWPLGIVLGHLGLRRARYTDDSGAGLATIALIVSYSLGFATLLLLVTHLAQGISEHA